MDTFSRDALRSLAAHHGGTCVSIYMPTHRAGPETQQSPIRLRNLLRTAEEQMVARGLRAPEARALLAPAERLAADSDFWRRQGDGLAAFISAEGISAYRLPLGFEEIAVIGDRMHIRPLLALFTGTGRFYVLAISQNTVRLLQGTRQSVADVDLAGAPHSMAEALHDDDFEKHTQLRSLSRFGGSGARGPVVGHGHEIDEKERIRRYLQLVNHGVHDALREGPHPLVLAAVEYEMALYREVNTYPHLLAEGIVGNPDLASADDLYRRGRDIVAPIFRQATADAVARYHSLAGTGSTADDVAEVVRAAASGRVDVLLVGSETYAWGTFDPGSLAVALHDQPRNGDEDLLDRAAVETLLKGGTVYTVADDDLPGGSAVAAILRY